MLTLLNFLFYFFVCTGMYFLRFIQACMQYIVWLAIFHVAKGGAHALYKLGKVQWVEILYKGAYVFWSFSY